MAHIQINYDEMRSVADDFLKQSEVIGQIINTLNARLEQLPTHWEGVAEQSFMQEFTNCQQQLKHIPAKLIQLSQALKETANNIEMAEREAARTMRDIGKSP